jgi:hypothetical protein
MKRITSYRDSTGEAKPEGYSGTSAVALLNCGAEADSVPLLPVTQRSDCHPETTGEYSPLKSCPGAVFDSTK